MKFLLQSRRSRIAFLHDVLMAALSFPLALYLRLGDSFWIFTQSYLVEGTLAFAAICAVVFYRVRLYRGIWRYASVDDLMALTKAVTFAILIFLPLLFFWTRLEFVPRSLPIINWFVLLAMLGGPRFLYRVMKDGGVSRVLAPSGVRRVPVLLLGAGDEAELFIRDQRRNRASPFHILAIVDEKGRRVGRDIRGVPVVATVDDLATLLESNRLAEPPSKIILTKDTVDGEIVRRVFDICETHGLTLARLPKMSELRTSGTGEEAVASSAAVRPIAVEDLLGRPQQPLDRKAIAAMVQGRRVLVTGAGGSIGSELVRQICALGPSVVVLFDASEHLLYEIDTEVRERFPGLQRIAMLGDVRDPVRVRNAMDRQSPELVFHAAALKHVPMVEANPMEGILTNVIGSRIVADACRAAGVACMVLISTDKAVNPTNVMGATKRMAETYIQALDLESRAAGETRYVVVRFGNVLGSSGSVVPLFRRQLEAGGPLTVTHPEITRYFMTIREAVELVLQASEVGIADSDAAGRIFVLDMGKPVKVLDLARQMIHLAGLQVDKDIRIEFTGLRPGEKMYEELLHDAETLIPTRAPGMTLAAPRAAALSELIEAFDRLESASRRRSAAEALEVLKSLVPEYRPTLIKGEDAKPDAPLADGVPAAEDGVPAANDRALTRSGSGRAAE